MKTFYQSVLSFNEIEEHGTETIIASAYSCKVGQVYYTACYMPFCFSSAKQIYSLFSSLLLLSHTPACSGVSAMAEYKDTVPAVPFFDEVDRPLDTETLIARLARLRVLYWVLTRRYSTGTDFCTIIIYKVLIISYTVKNFSN